MVGRGDLEAEAEVLLQFENVGGAGKTGMKQSHNEEVEIRVLRGQYLKEVLKGQLGLLFKE